MDKLKSSFERIDKFSLHTNFVQSNPVTSA